MRMTLLAVMVCLGASALPASAQSPILILPTSTIQVTASADHNKMSLDGVTPLVQKYQIQYCTTATPSTCLAALDEGKPTPDGSNVITFATGLWGVIAQNTAYTAKVIAVGPGGSSASAPSVPFGMPGAPVATPAPLIKQ